MQGYIFGVELYPWILYFDPNGLFVLSIQKNINWTPNPPDFFSIKSYVFTGLWRRTLYKLWDSVCSDTDLKGDNLRMCTSLTPKKGLVFFHKFISGRNQGGGSVGGTNIPVQWCSLFFMVWIKGSYTFVSAFFDSKSSIFNDLNIYQYQIPPHLCRAFSVYVLQLPL